MSGGKGLKVLVTGAGGMLGQAVMAELGRRAQAAEGRFQAVGCIRRELDICDLEAVRRVLGAVRPDVVVNCAAYTDVDGAESHPDEAYRVNAVGARNLAVACLDAGAALVHISTDYVFDGAKAEPYGVYDHPAPLSVYGASKLWGEESVREVLARHYIVRTSWLFGPGGRNFVDTMLRLASQGGPLRVVDDQHGSPTYTVDLACAICDLILTGCYGTYHVTNQGVTTWYGLARKVFEVAGLQPGVTPVAASEFPRTAKRPRNSAMDPFPLKETIGWLLPPWGDAVARYLSGVLPAAQQGQGGMGGRD